VDLHLLIAFRPNHQILRPLDTRISCSCGIQRTTSDLNHLMNWEAMDYTLERDPRRGANLLDPEFPLTNEDTLDCL